MPLSAAEKNAAYRARMNASGLRLMQVWVPDTNAPDFDEEARRQMALVRDSPHEREELDFIEALTAENAEIYGPE